MKDLLSRTIKVDIDGTEYLITKHPGLEGMNLSLRLTSLLSVAVGDLMKPGDDVSKIVDNIGGDNIVDIVQSLASIAGDPETPALMRDLLRYTSRNGAPLSNDEAFDDAFAGNYAELYTVVAHSIMGNGFLPVVDTFTGVMNAFGLKAKALTKPSKD